MTVWFVTITGSMLAYGLWHSEYMNQLGDDLGFTWLLVMEEKRKIADGRERKNSWAADMK